MDGSYVLAAAGPSASTSTASVVALPTPPHRTDQIRTAAAQNDLARLRTLAQEQGGFESDAARRAAWPALLRLTACAKGKQVARPEPKSKRDDGSELPPHQDEDQVRLDVNRSFVSFPANISLVEKAALRARLETLIVTVLRRHPALRYFQGYHDIVSILLLTLEDDGLALQAAEVMSLHRLRDSMGLGLEPVLGYLRIVQRVLDKADPELAKTVEIAAALPYFSLSWVLTLMSHDLSSSSTISRLFDFLLAFNPAMVSYLAVAIVLLKKDELLDLDEDDIDDPAILHHTLSKVPEIADVYADSSPLATPPTRSRSKSIDEDLLSNDDRSLLSESLVSTSEYDDLSSTSDDLDDSIRFNDSMLSDPDVYGPAFTSDIRPSQPSERTLTPAASPVKAAAPSVTLESLIARTMELWEAHPLLGEGGIAADEVMGPKSCIFTWPLSMEGALTDLQADDIAAKGVDIVQPETLAATLSEDRAAVELALQARLERSRRALVRRKMEVGVGTALALLGVAGVLLALYGGEEMRGWRAPRWLSVQGWALSWSF